MIGVKMFSFVSVSPSYERNTAADRSRREGGRCVVP